MKLLREKEKESLTKTVEDVKLRGQQQADEIKSDLQIRLEKQVAMIEGLLADKKSL